LNKSQLRKVQFPAAKSPYRVDFEDGFQLADAPTKPPDDAADKPERKKILARQVASLTDLQHALYAEDRRALLLIFQGMDAAGKDSTVRAVLAGVDPAGCVVHSFKQPSVEELAHDFLWRTILRLPAHGRIGVFNRSYYEEVLAVRVHPELLQAQKLPEGTPLDELWQQRYAAIRNHELHLAQSGTVILKFWLNVSREEQQKRLLDRLDEPEKNWKFEAADVAERARWPDYMAAFEAALKETSRPWAPWYAIPADSKSYLHMTVAQIIADTLCNMKLSYPQPAKNQRKQFGKLRKRLEKQAD